MTLNQTRRKCNLFYRVTSFFTLLSFISTILLPANLSYAQVAPYVVQVLPAPGTMVNMSPAFTPVIMRGIEIHPNNPLEFDFFIDSGDTGMQGKELEQEATKLIKYFMASMTVPEDDLWVNLSPYEKDQITTETLSVTDLGRDMLAQDYLLKQLTASLMYPENELGKKFWDRVYKKAYEMYGTTDVPVNTFNKVWIYPEKAKVYVQDNMAFVVETHLKVVLEKDYLSLTQNIRNQNLGTDQLNENEVKELDEVSAKIVQEILLPEIEKEVNEGQNFANLRQIMNSLILAVWYKKNLRESLLGQVYADQGKIKGIDIDDKDAKEKIYQQYLEAFRQGVYDYIKEDYDPQSQQEIPRRYFSGGLTGSKDTQGVPISQRMEETKGNFDTALNSQEKTAVKGKGKISKIKTNLVENAGKDDLSRIQPQTPSPSQPQAQAQPKAIDRGMFNDAAEDNPQKGKGTITHQEVDSAIANAWNQGLVYHMSPVMVNEYIEYLLTNRPKLEKVLKETDGVVVTFDDVLSFARTVVTNEDLKVTDKSKKSAGGKELGASKKYFLVTNGQDAIVEGENGYQIGHIGGIRSGDAYVYLTDDVNMHSSSWNQADRAFIPVLMFREAVFALETKVLYQNAEHRKRDDDYKRIVAQGRTVAEAVEKKLVGKRLDEFVEPRIAAEWKENQRARKQGDADQDGMAWFLPETQLTNGYIRRLNAAPSSTLQEKIKALEQKKQGKIRKYFSNYYNWRIEGIEKGEQKELQNIYNNKIKAIRRLGSLKNTRSFNRLLEELNKVDPLNSEAMGEELVMAVLNHQNPKAVVPLLEYIKASQVLPSLAVVEGLQKLGADPKTLDVILSQINDMEFLGQSRKLAGNEKAFLTSQQMSDVFVEQLRAAKENRNSPLRYYVSAFAGSTGKEKGVAITADWGGTNFELKLEQVMAGQEKTKLIARSNLRWQKKHFEGDADVLFGAMAAQIKELLNTPEARDFFAANPEKQKNIAFGMGAGFPGKAKGYSYVLADKAKEFEMTGVIGQDMGKLLQKALNAAGIKNVQVLPIMNDAEALGAMGYSAALIDGTGFGGSFYDPILKKIVNAEFGFFGDRGAVWGTNEDYIVWHDLKPAGSKMLEKQVAGGYIGEIVRLRLKALMDPDQAKSAGMGFLQHPKFMGPEYHRRWVLDRQKDPSFMPQGSFSSELMVRIIKETNPEKIIAMLNAEKKLGLGDVTVTSEDAMMVRRISRLVYERAAERLAVAAVSVDRFVDQLEIESLERLVLEGEATEGQKEELTARKALIEDGALLSRSHRNAIHGSVMEDPLMQKLLRDKIAAMVETEEAEKIELVIVDDYSPGIARTALQVQELLARGENPWAEEMKDEILVVASDQKWLDRVSDSLEKQYNVFAHKIPVRDALRVVEDIEQNPARFRMVIVDSSMTIGETNLITVLKGAFPSLPVMGIKDVTSGPEEAAQQEAALNEANGSLDKAETDANAIRASVQEAIAKFEEDNPSAALEKPFPLETGYVLSVAEAEQLAGFFSALSQKIEGQFLLKALAQTVKEGRPFDLNAGGEAVAAERERMADAQGRISPDVWAFAESRIKVEGEKISINTAGLKGLVSPVPQKTEKDVKYSFTDNGATLVIENYNQAPTFHGFLPSITFDPDKIDGTMMGNFYTNRYQAMSSSVVGSKDQAIEKFKTANQAERQMLQGFRTLLKIHDVGDTIVWEPFADNPWDNEYRSNQTMYITSHDVTIEDRNEKLGLVVRVNYATMPGEPYAALIRTVTVENISGKVRTIEMIDGLAEMVPTGVVEWHTSHMDRTMLGFMDTKIIQEYENILIVRTKTQLTDKPLVIPNEGANFYMAIDKKTGQLLRTTPNAADVFGSNTSLQNPKKFKDERNFQFPDQSTVSPTQSPSAFAFTSLQLDTFGKEEVVSLLGNVSSPEKVVGILAQVRSVSKDNKTFIDAKLEENKRVVDKVKNYAKTHGNRKFAEFAGQTFLDNTLRGGLPVSYKTADGRKVVVNVFNRKHGDQERDYNWFNLSTGEGGKRDVEQNQLNDVRFNPDVRTKTIHQFMDIEQADGYNPLVVKSPLFSVDANKIQALIAQNVDGRATKEQGQQLSDYLTKGFVLVSLLPFVKDREILLKVSHDEFVQNVLAVAVERNVAAHGEGFWTDHWTYDLALIKSFLSVYPEELRMLLLEDATYSFYRNNHYVLPRDQRLVFDPSKDEKGKVRGVRQYNSVKDGKDDPALKGKDEFLRTKNGKVYQTTLIVKLLTLAANKAASFDPSGIGIEMEADKPSWYDSLNGLPGMLGSSISETMELELLSKFLLSSIDQLGLRADDEIPLFEELNTFILQLGQLLETEQDPWAYWQQANTFKEDYRSHIRAGISGGERMVEVYRIQELLTSIIERTKRARKEARKAGNGELRTYFYHEATEYTLLPGQDSEKRYYARPTAFKMHALPAFLEGYVHELRLVETKEEARAIYQEVSNGPLFDKKLKMYKLNASLEGLPLDLGRVILFPKGWLENGSIWMHMEFKFMLELLKNELYEEYYENLPNVLPAFMDPKVYGRSTNELVSFIVSSDNPDEKLHGRGFVARLSGSTAEFIDMWLRMGLGNSGFQLDRNKQVTLELNPPLAAWLFSDEAETIEYLDQDGNVQEIYLPENTYMFNLMNGTPVVIHNPQQIDTFGKDFSGIESIVLDYGNGRPVVITGNTLRSKDALDIRRRLVKKIDVYLVENPQITNRIVPQQTTGFTNKPTAELESVGAAQGTGRGGIDLNPALLDLQIKRDGNGIPLPMNQQPVTNMKIDGFLPVIINVTPVMSLPLLLGAKETTPNSDEKSRSEKTQASSNPWSKLGPMESKKRFEMDDPLEVSLLDN